MFIIKQQDDDTAKAIDQNDNNIAHFGLVATASTATNVSNVGMSLLASTAAKTFTMDAPAVGCQKQVICTAASTTVQTLNSGSTGITFDGSADTLTFNGNNEAVILQGISTTRWAILSNTGGVGIA